GQVSDQLEQDHLGDVLGVGLLELPAQAPGMDLRAVAVDEGGPGGLIGRVVAEGHQDADARAAAGRLGHASTPGPRSRTLTDATGLPGAERSVRIPLYPAILRNRSQEIRGLRAEGVRTSRLPRYIWGDSGFDGPQAYPFNEVRDHRHPMVVQSGSRLGA